MTALIRLFILLFLGVLFHTSPAEAHRLNIFASVNEAGLDGQVYYAGGGPAGELPVSVHDLDGQLIAEGQTTTEGTFHVPLAVLKPHLGKAISMTSNSGEGHSATFHMILPADATLPETTEAKEAPDKSGPGPKQFMQPLLMLLAIFGLLYWIKSIRRKQGL